MEKGFFHPIYGYWQTISDPDAATLAGYPEGTVEVPLKPSVDCEWNGEAWVYVTPSNPTPEELRATLPPITRRQLRLTLVRYGEREGLPSILNNVATLIETMPDGLVREEARIEWADATHYERLHPTLILIGQGLGLTPEQVDALWAEAMKV